MQDIDTDTLEPLLMVIREQPDPELRLAALDAAARFPLDQNAWQEVAHRTYRIVRDEPPGSQLRRARWRWRFRSLCCRCGSTCAG